jgi:putative ABC transport system substrate-binding protein
VKRREFIALLGGAAMTWPLAARAQQSDQTRRVGLLMNSAADSPEAQPRLSAFQEGLQQFGWTDGSNVQIDIRWGANDVELERRYAAELASLAPDLVVAAGTLSVAALHRVTRTLPILFCNVADPVGAGFVDSLARPGGNTTGFTLFEYTISAKWLEILKEINPGLKRAGVLRDPSNPAAIAQFGVIQAAAQSLGVDLRPISIADAAEIERAITTFANGSAGGLIVTPSATESFHRELIVRLATRYGLPAVYPFRVWAAVGGLISYGPDSVEQFRQVTAYVDRVLRGTKPADLPVQAPTKYQLVINLKTAKALGLTLPPTLLARADEVIE